MPQKVSINTDTLIDRSKLWRAMTEEIASLDHGNTSQVVTVPTWEPGPMLATLRSANMKSPLHAAHAAPRVVLQKCAPLLRMKTTGSGAPPLI